MSNSQILDLKGDSNLFRRDAELASRETPDTPELSQWIFKLAAQPRIYHIAVSYGTSEAVTAYCVELPGAITEADDEETAIEQIRVVIRTLFEEYRSMESAVPWVSRDLEEHYEIKDSIVLHG